MAQFKLENELSRVLTLDAPLTNGPKPRYERKSCKPSNNSSSLISTPFKGNNSQLNKSNAAKSPTKTPGKTKYQTPGKLKNSSGKKKTPKTTPCIGDRFIASRSSTQFDLGYYKLTQHEKENCEDDLTPNTKEYQRLMSENLNGRDVKTSRIIHFNANKAPLAPEGYLNNLRVVYSQSKNPGSSRKSMRHIPSMPERILDAPEIVDDYYLNLLDWSANNHLALSLANVVYLWNASNGEIKQLMSMDGSNDYISSVSWIKEGTHLAVGTSLGNVQIWDVSQTKRVRNMSGHASRVGSLSWNSYIVSSGSKTGHIHHHDVRIPDHLVGNSENHTQEICGLRWSSDGRYLASGGNDNLLNIWAQEASGMLANSTPLLTFTQHQAAVKALNWCPWQHSILASGGGTSDRCIKFWNANTGICLNSVDTNSQVCGILWSKEYKELISGHGFANNQLIIWKYPTMQQVAQLTGHSSRILHMTMSPDGSCVASAAADETLRLWHCFPVDTQKKTASKSLMQTKSCFKQSIR